MKIELKNKARSLRCKGYSIKEISEILSISKSTTSICVRKEKISIQGQKRLHNLSVFGGMKARKKLLDKQERWLADLENSCGALRNGNKYSLNDLKIFLSLLYWGEGAKTERRVVFTNSDHKMVKVFLDLLRKSFKTDLEKFSATLHLHDYHNRKLMTEFWSSVTGIDKKRISIYNKMNSSVRKKADYKGCISVRYGDYKIHDEIMLIIKRFSNFRF